ncbi:hypothetical protein [Streptomyces sp. NTH33]|uniref:hypothetical protein n=1 Tax=Streptomyces sp. NTH33 TaxID=1735453 RepID=UPI0011B93A2F|nr:hypothetical protein [Streptomyces sp. NTH33]
MHWILAGAFGVGMVLMAAAGVAAIAAEWVVPWAQGWIFRPRLWGCGALLCGCGGSLFVFLGPFSHSHGIVLPVAGWCAFAGGVVLQGMAKRPGRRVR